MGRRPDREAGALRPSLTGGRAAEEGGGRPSRADDCDSASPVRWRSDAITLSEAPPVAARRMPRSSLVWSRACLSASADGRCCSRLMSSRPRGTGGERTTMASGRASPITGSSLASAPSCLQRLVDSASL
ncbi:hypothetical protein CDD83_1312 [Cordyceps sp. RAO-2017]|nr:hypothetical protein CDD83_1312 [Cordyceps sp. RAO-2017]